MTSYLERIQEAQFLNASIVRSYHTNAGVQELLLRFQSSLSQFVHALREDPASEERIIPQVERIVSRTEFYAAALQPS